MPDSPARQWARWALVLFYGVAGVAHLLLAPDFLRIVPARVPWPEAW